MRPSPTFGEPISVTVTLPSSAYVAVRRGSNGGDVKASPRVQLYQCVGLPSSTLAVAGYEWVRDVVLK